MATWDDLAGESGRAAAAAVREGHHRVGASRAYYSLYALLAGRLTGQGMARFGDFENPPHRRLPELARSNIAGLGRQQRRELSQAVRRLYKRRVSADYLPGDGVGPDAGRGALRDLALAERILGVDR